MRLGVHTRITHAQACSWPLRVLLSLCGKVGLFIPMLEGCMRRDTRTCVSQLPCTVHKEKHGLVQNAEWFCSEQYLCEYGAIFIIKTFVS